MNELVTASTEKWSIPEPNPKYWLATQMLDVFTKVFCIKRNDDDLEFECEICPFQDTDGTCRVKIFKRDLCPEYKDFGAMSR